MCKLKLCKKRIEFPAKIFQPKFTITKYNTKTLNFLFTINTIYQLSVLLMYCGSQLWNDHVNLYSNAQQCSRQDVTAMD